MKTIAYADLLAKQDRYWRGRWSYLSRVAQMLHALPDGRVLEIGPYNLPLVPGSTVMDLTAEHCPAAVVHDADQTPWPFADAAFEVALALQVWEHLRRPQEAFQELRRVSRRIILSVPWQWPVTRSAGHEGIGLPRVLSWSGGWEPVEACRTRHEDNGLERLICLWEAGR